MRSDLNSQKARCNFGVIRESLLLAQCDLSADVNLPQCFLTANVLVMQKLRIILTTKPSTEPVSLSFRSFEISKNIQSIKIFYV